MIIFFFVWLFLKRAFPGSSGSEPPLQALCLARLHHEEARWGAAGVEGFLFTHGMTVSAAFGTLYPYKTVT